MKRKLFSIMLALCMVLSLLPTTVNATDSEYVLVGDVRLNNGQYLVNGASTASSEKPASNGYAYFNHGILTLNNADIANTISCYNEDMTIKLLGDSTVSNQIENLWGSLTIEGPGSLTVTGDYRPIDVSGILTVNSAAITVTGNSYDSLVLGYHGVVVNGGQLTAINSGTAFAIDCYEMYNGQITINNGHVIAKTAGTQAFGKNVKVTVPYELKTSEDGATTDETADNAYNALDGAYYEITAPEARWGKAATDNTAPDSWIYGSLTKAMDYAKENDQTYIQLLQNVVTTETLLFNRPAILDLNGKTITGGEGEYEIIELWYGGDLTLCDSSSTSVASQGKITGYGRTETDNPNPDSGRGVSVFSGTFTMTGGTIAGNHIRNAAGGGVFVGSGGTFNMTGGAITGNNEAGVSVLSESDSPATVNLSGGSITGNDGGGVQIGVNVDTASNVIVNISGDIVIKDNYYNGKLENGVYVQDDTSSKANLTLAPGASPVNITGELTSGSSIGIYAYDLPTPENPIAITGSSSTDYSSYFSSDHDNCYISNSGSGNSQTVQLKRKAKAETPSGIDKTDCTTTANNDGTITGVKNTMEYKQSSDTEYSAIDGTVITGLADGTYDVRVKATETTLASDDITVTIAAYVEHTVFLPTVNGITVTPTADSAASVVKGGSYSFTVTVDNGYHKTSDFKVMANDAALTEAEGIYTITDINEDQTITIQGVTACSYEPAWKHNTSMHWHECSCGATADTAFHTPGAAATETTPQTCTVCGYVFQEALGHSHKGTLVSATPATCTNPGSKAYYTCTCGKYFEDAACSIEITDIDAWKTITPPVHDFSIIQRNDTTKPSKPDDTVNPKTNDSTNLTLLAALLFVSCSAVIGTMIYNKRKKLL